MSAPPAATAHLLRLAAAAAATNRACGSPGERTSSDVVRAATRHVWEALTRRRAGCPTPGSSAWAAAQRRAGHARAARRLGGRLRVRRAVHMAPSQTSGAGAAVSINGCPGQHVRLFRSASALRVLRRARRAGVGCVCGGPASTSSVGGRCPCKQQRRCTRTAQATRQASQQAAWPSRLALRRGAACKVHQIYAQAAAGAALSSCVSSHWGVPGDLVALLDHIALVHDAIRASSRRPAVRKSS